MNGTAIINVNPLPIAYNVTGGGSYCQGGNGFTVGLDTSEIGVMYQLNLNGGNVGSPVAGNGAAISFGNQSAQGNYTVTANNISTGCVDNMSGSVNITVNALPTAYNVIGGGPYCQGDNGVTVGLDNSQTGVMYQLNLNGGNISSPVAGNGAAISFGNQSAQGNYTVTANNISTGCVDTMSGSVNISVNALPTAYNVTGGGTFCSGGTGVAVGLSSSQTGITYQVMVNGVNVASVSGTGSAINFGIETSAGNYTVKGTDNSTGCSINMSGNANITVYPLPTAILTPAGPIQIIRDSLSG